MGLSFPNSNECTISIKCVYKNRKVYTSTACCAWGANIKYRRLNDSRIGLYWPSFVTVLLCQLCTCIRIEREREKWWALGVWVPAHVFSLFCCWALLKIKKKKKNLKKSSFFPVCVWPMHTSCFIPPIQPTPLLSHSASTGHKPFPFSPLLSLSLFNTFFFLLLFTLSSRPWISLWTGHCTYRCVYLYTHTAKALSNVLLSRPLCVCLYYIPSKIAIVYTLNVNPRVWNLAAHLYISVWCSS